MQIAWYSEGRRSPRKTNFVFLKIADDLFKGILMDNDGY